MYKIRPTYLVLLLPFLLLVPTARAGRACPEGFSEIYKAKNCYMFVNTRVTWLQAVLFCRYLHGNLIEIKTEEDNCAITSSSKWRYSGPIWVGATDLIAEGDWRWISNNSQIGKFADWEHPNPNNFMWEEHCLELQYYEGYKWNDANCNDQNVFICEKPYL